MVIKSPSWLKPFLDRTAIAQVEEGIKSAERTTSGELVVMIVCRSSAIGHVYPMMAFSIFALATGLMHGHAGLRGLAEYGVLAHLLILALSFALAWPLAALSSVQRILTTAADRWHQTAKRAELEFFKTGLHATDGGTGVLLFISLMEHHVYVLADHGIAARLPQETWAGMSEELTRAIRQGNFSKALLRAIRQAGDILATHFPAGENNRDEVVSTLLIKGD